MRITHILNDPSTVNSANGDTGTAEEIRQRLRAHGWVKQADGVWRRPIQQARGRKKKRAADKIVLLPKAA